MDLQKTQPAQAVSTQEINKMKEAVRAAEVVLCSAKGHTSLALFFECTHLILLNLTQTLMKYSILRCVCTSIAISI